jgi:hypothetical protein
MPLSTNSQQIVLQVRTEFEALLHFVLHTAERSVVPADTMERNLLRRVFELGRLLLWLYVVRVGEIFASETVLDETGATLPFHSQKERPYYSVFGKVRFTRRYYYRQGEGRFPVDAALNLPPKGVSDLVREWREKLGAYLPYHKAGTALLLPEVSFSSRALKEDVAEDAKLVAAYYEQADAPRAHPSASILVAQADGKGVPMLQAPPQMPKVRLGKGEKTTKKKEAVVTSVSTLAPCVRTPEEVIASLFQQVPPSSEKPARSHPHNKWLWATLEGKEAALHFTTQQVAKQEGRHIRQRVALTDGQEALQNKVQEHLTDFQLVLDFIHADEYLWKAANALLGETAPERTQWVKERTLRLLEGQTDAVIADLRELAEQPCGKPTAKQTLLGVAAYYERNRSFMRYDQYLAQGWPIATGVIEGACRHLVKDRCELSGMRWSQPGAEALLRLRCVAENGDWEDFHAYRRTQRQKQLYPDNANTAYCKHPVELRMAA